MQSMVTAFLFLGRSVKNVYKKIFFEIILQSMVTAFLFLGRSVKNVYKNIFFEI